MRLSKEKIKKHQQALELLEKDKLNYYEKIFVLENYHEGATHMNGLVGAFFTPVDLARDFQMSAFDCDGRIIDLCAGIGALSFQFALRRGFENLTDYGEIVCVEQDPEYVEVGKKILPEANWVCGNVFNKTLIEGLGEFELAISNPPFGNIKTGDSANEIELDFKGKDFDLRVVELGGRIAQYGSFILPQGSTPYRWSGNNGRYEDLIRNCTCPKKVKKFIKETGLEFQFNSLGLDTSQYREMWKGVKPICEIVLVEYPEKEEPISKTVQLEMFA